METKIININDIEDLILCKFEIENKLLEKGIIESKMQIDDDDENKNEEYN